MAAMGGTSATATDIPMAAVTENSLMTVQASTTARMQPPIKVK